MVRRIVQRAAGLPGLRRRRVRWWLAVLSAIVAALVLRALFADAWWMPAASASVEGLGAWVVLAVFLVALTCEYVDSALGMGYGTTLTPLLLLAGFEPLDIVPCVLLSELITGLLAGVMHHRDGNVDFVNDRRARGTVVLLSLLSVVGAVAAVTLALSIPKFWLALIISVIILSIGVVTLATVRRSLRYRRGHIVAIGAVAAFNKGLSGGGYGPLVTAGQVVSGLSPKHAVAITSLAESLTCAVALAAYFTLSGGFNLALAVPLTAGAVMSVPMATLTVRRLPEPAMRGAVGVTTCLLGGLGLFKVLAG